MSATNEFYPHAIIDNTVTGDYDGDENVDCTAIEFWMVAENDEVFFPLLVSDLEQPEKWFSAGTYYRDRTN